MGVDLKKWGKYLALVSVLLRLLSLPLLPLLDSGEVPLTDVDYSVFRQSYAHAKSDTGNYYDRATYRYPPIVAYLVGIGGRVALVAADIAVGLVLGAMTTAAPKPTRVGGNGIFSWLVTLASTPASLMWLLNPLTAAISVRGNAESVVCLFVLITVRLAECRRSDLSALAFGLSVYLKPYMPTYGIALCLHAAIVSGPASASRTRLGFLASLRRSISLGLSAASIRFGLISVATFFSAVVVTAVMLAVRVPSIASHGDADISVENALFGRLPVGCPGWSENTMGLAYFVPRRPFGIVTTALAAAAALGISAGVKRSVSSPKTRPAVLGACSIPFSLLGFAVFSVGCGLLSVARYGESDARDCPPPSFALWVTECAIGAIVALSSAAFLVATPAFLFPGPKKSVSKFGTIVSIYVPRILSLLFAVLSVFLVAAFVKSDASLLWEPVATAGAPFVNEAYLYHATRRDHRHNMSVYHYATYLEMMGAGEKMGRLLGILTLLPSLLPPVFLALFLFPSRALDTRVRINSEKSVNATCADADAANRSLRHVLFAMTLCMVAFNKVVTAQYFSWWLCLAPSLSWTGKTDPPMRDLRWMGMRVRTPFFWAVLFGLWYGLQVAWLSQGYAVEFLGRPSFLYMWASGLGMFAASVVLIIAVVRFAR